jgi:hypothetical protein
VEIQPTFKDIQIMCEEFMHRSEYAKTEMCKEEAMSDNPPMLLIGFVSDPLEDDEESHESALEFQNEFETSKAYKMMMIPLIHRDDVGECVRDVMKFLDPMSFSFVAFAAEGYVSPELDETAKDSYKRGDMEKEFKENPFTVVKEAMMINIIDWNCENMFTLVKPYSYDDFGVPVFGESKETVTTLGGYENCSKKIKELELGKIGSMMLAFVLFSHYKLDADKFADKITEAPKRKKKKDK